MRVEDERDDEGFLYDLGNGKTNSSARTTLGSTPPEGPDLQRYGSGVIASMAKGDGEVFCAGNCEWLTGLACGAFTTEQVTRNVLNRFLDRA